MRSGGGTLRDHTRTLIRRPRLLHSEQGSPLCGVLDIKAEDMVLLPFLLLDAAFGLGRRHGEGRGGGGRGESRELQNAI